MSQSDERIRMLLANTAALGLPAQDLVELVEANITGNVLESVMRVRALTELSNQMDTAALMALAAMVARRGGLAAEMTTTFEGLRH